MFKSFANFDKLRNLSPKRRQTEHRALTITKLLTGYDGPVSIYRIHKDLTDENYHQQLRSFEKKIQVTLGNIGFAQVLRLIKQMQERGFVSSKKGKRNAWLIDLTFNGFLFGWISCYISREEAMRYLARKVPFVRVFEKLWSRSEHPERYLEREWALVESIVFPYLIPEALQMEEPGPIEPEYIVLSEEEYFLIIELGFCRLLLILMKKGKVSFDDFKTLSKEEGEILKKTWSMYLNKARDWHDLYDFGFRYYEEKIKSM
jgi:hypothetical protein